MVWVGIPVSITGVILIAQPAALFGGASNGGLTAGAVFVGLSQAAFAASHKMCIRYLKSEDSSVQLMYLGETLVGSQGQWVQGMHDFELTCPSPMLALGTSWHWWGSLLQHHPGHAHNWLDLCLAWMHSDGCWRLKGAPCKPLHFAAAEMDPSLYLSAGGVSVLGSLFMCLVTWSFAVPATFTGWLLLIGTGAGVADS